MRVLLIGGTGPVGQSALPHLLAAGHSIAVAHSGAHEPPGLPYVEHLHGGRDALLATGGPVERWAPEAVVDTFTGGATADKALELGWMARRCAARQIVAVSSLDVYRHCAVAGVDGHTPRDLALDALPLHESTPRRTGPSQAAAFATEGAPCGRWECNVCDPRDFTFGALAALVAERLDWCWEPVDVPWHEGDHPWNVRHPVVADTSRLRDVLRVTDPDPVAATLAQIDWLWEHRAEAASVSS
jgi:nucleoside-diphosphate-sugar epimerase